MGLAAAIVAAIVGAAGGGKLWFAIAQVGAWINIFNLLPVWQLDGGRAFASLTRYQRAVAAAALGAGWIITRDGLVLLVALVAVAQPLAAGPLQPIVKRHSVCRGDAVARGRLPHRARHGWRSVIHFVDPRPRVSWTLRCAGDKMPAPCITVMRAASS